MLKALPPRLPALLFARGVYKELVKKGLIETSELDRAAIQDSAQRLDEVTLGRDLFNLAAAARERGIDPESALRRFTQSLIDRHENA